MPPNEADERGLFQRLFDKSSDEIENLEAPDLLKPADAPTTDPAETEEDRIIRERVRKFREMEGRDPDTGEKISLLNPLGSEPMAEGFMQDEDPIMAKIAPTTPATPEMEQELAKAVIPIFNKIYKEGPGQIIRNMRLQENYYEGVSSTAALILEARYKEMKQDGKPVDATLFFGQNGLIQTTVDALTDLAKQAKLVGSDDPNQYAAAVIDTYRRAGEYVLKSKDSKSMLAAQDLMVDVAMTGQDGSELEPREFEGETLKRRALSAGVRSGLESQLDDEMDIQPGILGA